MKSSVRFPLLLLFFALLHGGLLFFSAPLSSYFISPALQSGNLGEGGRIQVGIKGIEHPPVSPSTSSFAKKSTEVVREDQVSEGLSGARSDAPSVLGAEQLEYPLASRRLGETGDVALSFTILQNGETADIIISKSSGHPRLDQAAVDFLKKRRYQIPSGWRSAQAARQNLTISYRL